VSAQFIEIQKVLDFYLDDKGEVWAVFVKEDDQRRFPLKSLVVQAQLQGLVAVDEKGKKVARSVDALMFECVRHATRKYRSKSDRDDDVLEEDGLVCAILNRLARLNKDGHKPEFTGTVTELRKDLVELPEEERFDANEWPTGSRFATFLRARANVLERLKVELSYKRAGTARRYTLRFVGKRADAKHVQVTDEDDLFEMLRMYHTKPTTGQSAVAAVDPKQTSQGKDDADAKAGQQHVSDAGDAQNAPPASQGGDTADADTGAKTSSSPTGKQTTERVSSPKGSTQDPTGGIDEDLADLAKL
jgi:hypothetical protein